MSNRRFVLIVNPRGGVRAGLEILDLVRPRFETADATLDVYVTAGPGDAERLARTLDLARMDGVCLIGGDGTLHEVANGLLGRSEAVDVPIGIIPGGTGNAVLLHFGCETAADAVDRILSGRTRKLDLLQLTTVEKTVYCVNIVGWGALVDVSLTAERWRRLGPMRYSLAALCNIACPTVRTATLWLDGERSERELLFVVACNTRFAGKRLNLAPRADAADGKMDVLIVSALGRAALLRLLQKVRRGSHLDLPGLDYRQVRSLRIESIAGGPLNLDGELQGTTPFVLTVLPESLRLFI